MPPPLSFDPVALPPLIFGTIRWKSSIGAPSGDLCSGFSILVEEFTPSIPVASGGGNYDKEHGTGIWKEVTDSLACHPLSPQGDYSAVSFAINGLHLNVFDGQYRIAPSLQGNWRPSGLLAALSYRAIEPIAEHVVLTEDHHIKSVEFEVVRRSFFSGRRLGT
jgi:hypothetical protein